MPSLFNFHFQKLIAAIPIDRHSVEVKKKNWKSLSQASDIFNNTEAIRISRSSIFATKNPTEKCIKILLWGYPKGIRGKQHKYFLKNLAKIAEACSPSQKGWGEFYDSFKKKGIKHLGISTISKLAYFHELKFESNKLSALILDSRIIKLLAARHWSEFEKLSSINYSNAHCKYVEYLSEFNVQSSCHIDFLLQTIRPIAHVFLRPRFQSGAFFF